MLNEDVETEEPAGSGFEWVRPTGLAPIDDVSGRDLYYSWAGDFDQVVGYEPELGWLRPVCGAKLIAPMGRGVGAGVLQGKRTLFHLGDKKLRVWLQRINECGKDGLCTAVVLMRLVRTFHFRMASPCLHVCMYVCMLCVLVCVLRVTNSM